MQKLFNFVFFIMTYVSLLYVKLRLFKQEILKNDLQLFEILPNIFHSFTYKKRIFEIKSTNTFYLNLNSFTLKVVCSFLLLLLFFLLCNRKL